MPPSTARQWLCHSRLRSTPMLFRLIRPALFALDPEIGACLGDSRAETDAKWPRQSRSAAPLATQVAGLDFPNPLGMAAGFDKDGEVPDALLGLGFGFAEVGSITPLPQAGNPKPRLFRLAEDRAVINRMGFNNRRRMTRRARLAARRARGGDRWHQYRRQQGFGRPNRRLRHHGAGDGTARQLSCSQCLQPQHAGPARAAGRGGAGRIARRGA